jgi:hypothetical protein
MKIAQRAADTINTLRALSFIFMGISYLLIYEIVALQGRAYDANVIARIGSGNNSFRRCDRLVGSKMICLPALRVNAFFARYLIKVSIGITPQLIMSLARVSDLQFHCLPLKREAMG